MSRRQEQHPNSLPGAIPGAPVLQVGDILRQQREHLGWDLGEVADWLRIRRSYLQALEEGQPERLPSGTYSIGFLRSYAAALGLDAQAAVERFRHESKGHLGHPDLSFPSPVPQRGVPAGAAILLGVVLLIGAYAGWYVFSAREARTVQPVPAVPDAMLAPPVTSTAPAAGQPVATSAAVAAAPAVQEEAATPAGMPVPSRAVAAATPPVAVPAPVASTPATAATAGPAASVPTRASTDTGTVSLKALAATWVRVRKADGTVIYDHVMTPGENWTVPDAAPSSMLTTGNAGGLALAVGDAIGPPLGHSGVVLRHVALDADAVRALNARLSTPAPDATATSPSGHTARP